MDPSVTPADFRHKTIQGVSWSMVGQLGKQILTIIISIILARLLTPEEFGMVAMVTVVTGYAIFFSDLGLGAAIIQKADIEPIHLSSVFWLNVVLGLLLTLLFIISAPLFVRFYDEPALLYIVIIVSLSFFVGSFGATHFSILTKRVDFLTIARVQILSLLMGGIVAIAMALTGFGIWSLVAQIIVRSFVYVLLIWFWSDWRPSFSFSWTAVKSLLGFGSNVLGTNTISYWSRNVDNILIGRFLGSASLGVYSRAYALLLFPLNNITGALSRVMFPSFALMQQDQPRLRRLYLRANRIVAFVIMPFCIGLLVVAQPFVLVIYGSQWIEMIPVLRILSIVAIVQSLEMLNQNLFFALGRSDLQFRLDIVLKGFTILGIIVGLRWGINGVAIGYAITSGIALVPGVFFAGRLIDLSVADFFKNLTGVFFAASAMGSVVVLYAHLISEELSDFLLLGSQILVGLVVYLFISYFAKVKAYQEMLQLLQEQGQQYMQQLKQKSA